MVKMVKTTAPKHIVAVVQKKGQMHMPLHLSFTTADGVPVYEPFLLGRGTLLKFYDVKEAVKFVTRRESKTDEEKEDTAKKSAKKRPSKA